MTVFTGSDAMRAFLAELDGWLSEHTVLGAVDGGVRDVNAIREQVLSDVREVSESADSEVDAAIDRLVRKQVLDRDGDAVASLH